MKHAILATALALLPTAAAASQQADVPPPDARWEPWIGCWQLVNEGVSGRTVSADDMTAEAAARSRRVVTGTKICVSRAGGGVTLTTIVGTETALQETLVAEGGDQPIRDAECSGSKRSEWSPTAPRLYSTANITCGSEAPRKISGVSMMLAGPTWVDVQLIDINGRKNIRVRRLQPADSEPGRRARLARIAGETAWTVDDVKEAAGRLAPEAVQAAIVELRSGFDLKSRQLVDLHRAGVAESIIDLMVALSYPDGFIVEQPVAAAPPLGYGSSYGYGMFDTYDPMWLFYMDSMFWSSYYSPFAYRYWGAYDPYYLPGSGYVVLQPLSDNTREPADSGDGRVVNGRGYTRVSTRAPEPARINDGGGIGTMSSGAQSSGGGGVSSGGYSSGGGGADGGRTAVSRPPGN